MLKDPGSGLLYSQELPYVTSSALQGTLTTLLLPFLMKGDNLGVVTGQDVDIRGSMVWRG